MASLPIQSAGATNEARAPAASIPSKWESDPLARGLFGDAEESVIEPAAPEPATAAIPRERGFSAAPPGRRLAQPVPVLDGQITSDRAPVWQQRLSAPSASWEYSTGVVAVGGRVFATGFGTGAESGFDALTAAYDATTGAELWRNRFDGEGHGYDRGNAVTVTVDGSFVFVTGYTWTGSRFALLTLCYQGSTGAEVWRAVRPSALNEGAFTMALSTDGSRVFVGGRTLVAAQASGLSVPVGGPAIVVAYDAATGLEVWSTNGVGGQDAGVLDLASTPDGSRVVATGIATTTNVGVDSVTLAIEAATGVVLWQTVGHETGDDFGVSIEADGSTVYLAESATAAGIDFRTRALDLQTGASRWTRVHGSGTTNVDVPAALGLSPDGSAVYVTGTTNYRGDAAYTTIAYRATSGDLLWIDDYQAGSGREQARDLAVLTDGSIVVTGSSDARDGRGLDVATLTLAPNDGAMLAVERFDDGPNDVGVALAADGGDVYVAADSWGRSSQTDQLVKRVGGPWCARYNGPGRYGYDAAYESVLSNGGDTLFQAGLSTVDGLRIATRALDASDGSQRWEASYALETDTDPGQFNDFPYAIAIDPADERVFVTGFVRVAEHRDGGDLFRSGWGTVAYDADTGAKLWSVTRAWPQERGAHGTHLLVSMDGATVFVVGNAQNPVGLGSATVIDARSAATGALLWSVRFGDGDDLTGGAALSADGSTVFVAARGWNGVHQSGYYVVVRALSAADGHELWKTKYGSNLEFFTSVSGLSVTDDGRLLLAATFEDENFTSQMLTAAFDAQTGEPLWSDLYGADKAFAEMIGAALSPDTETVYVSGREINDVASTTGNFVAGNDTVTIAYNARTGARRWVSVFDSGAAPNVRTPPEDLPADIAVSGDGATVVVVGMVFDLPRSWDELVLAYDAATGGLNWKSQLDGSGGGDFAQTVVTSSNGERAYVGGGSSSPTTWVDATARAYDLR